MSLHTRTATALRKKLQLSPKFSKVLLNEDGTIKLDYLPKANRGINSLYSQGVLFLKTIYWKLLVSPFFLVMMISVMLMVPRKLLLFKKVVVEIYSDTKRILKRLLDILGAVLALTGSSLVFLILPILIKLDSKGSVIFKQVRVGKDRRRKERRMIALDVPVDRRQANRRQDDLLGKPFVVYKFRSMKENAEKKTGPVWATDDDPRVTNVGKVLRPYHLDELPQFINILRGEMSLVGPRPERPEFINKLRSAVPNYEKRFKSKPGLTGLAQISCGYDTSIDDVNKKLAYDLYYIENSHFSTDIKIICDTVKNLLVKNKSNGTATQ